MGALFTAELKRDLLLAFRRRSDLLNPLLFCVMVAALFPLGVSPLGSFLQQIAPGVIWVCALLATLLSLDTLFKSDYDDGTLEQLLISPEPMYVVALAKTCAHWLTTGLPLALIAPVLGVVLFLPVEAMPELIMSLLIGTPTLSLIGAIAAALTVSLKKGGVLISLLVMPLYIPVLIFGASSVQAASQGLPVSAYLAILGALFLLSLVLAPFAIAASLRISVSS
ncbi:MAG: heme exporter protein CcmB [Pseudomonadales bacterium]